ncbi:DUF3995 domain-containing protein [Flavobacterium sp. UMI-01]|uniref:DUF3995 domain-containing protein n=1 Tax=Flavobacterium sp. UMI-01 TaxID=1441053 RepID=UPI001C7DD0E2|nr:DUF3995 domain-containing protein [Flavobacterium sp. UMI-01]GIZ07599.1 membrane protein [Flavobacterium sp. UMI-01]
MIPTIAILLFSVFLFLSGIHFYWALGGKWGTGAVFPTQPETLKPQFPGPVPTAIVGICLMTIGLFYLVKAEILTIQLPELIHIYGLKFLTVLFTIRAIGEFNYIGFFKKYKQTRFGNNDTKYYSPLCVLIAILTFMMDYIL